MQGNLILEAINWFLNPSGFDRSSFNDPDEPIAVEELIEGVTKELLEETEERHRGRIESYVSNGKILFKRVRTKPGE